MKNIIAFGNPLLDTIVLIKDDFLLKKYNLKNDGQKEVLQNDMKLLTEDVKEYNKKTTAGGCAQNTLQVMQWLLKKKCLTTIFGAIGKDNEGRTLKRILKEHGVETNYITQQDYPTGTTVALVNGESRSLVAHLGAAEVISMNDVMLNLDVTKIEKSHLIYMEGFFLTKRIKVATFILDQCSKFKKEFAFNLSGEYLCKEYPETVKYFLLKSSIIFGNRREFEAISPVMNEDNAESLVMSLGKLGKTVVMTNGSATVICVGNRGEIYCEIEVPKLKSNEIVDTTGAGDAFVAGFLTGYLLEKPLEFCSELGCYAAQVIIKRKGCAIPTYSPTYVL